MQFSSHVAKAEVCSKRIKSNDIICNIDDEKIKDELHTFLNDNNDIFAEGLHDIGLTDAIQMKIEVTTNVPVAQKPYRVIEPKKCVISKMINDLLECDIITNSKSEYASQ